MKIARTIVSGRYAIGGAILAILLFGLLSQKLPAQAATLVNVINSFSNPVNTRDVAQISKQPFVESVDIQINPGSYSIESPEIFTPAGKRRVIEFAALRTLSPVGQTLHVVIDLGHGPNGNLRWVALPSTFQGNLGGDLYASTQSMRLYVPSKTAFKIVAYRNSYQSYARFIVTYSGYLEDAY